MTIPARTNRFHQMPYWLGDSLWAIGGARHAANRRGHKAAYIDQNMNLSGRDPKTGLRTPVMLHWPEARKNGFRWRFTGRYHNGHEIRVRLRLPRGAQVSDYTAEQIGTWRRTKRPGRARASRVRVSTYYAAAQHARSLDVTICGELKPRLWATPDGLKTMRAMKAWDRRHHVTTYLMTLQSMKHPFEKLANADDADYENAILPRGRIPASWRTVQSKFVDVVWGRWKR